MRRGEPIFNYVVMLGPLVIGLGVAWTMGHSMSSASLWAMIATFLAGFASFAKAKLSVIGQGQLVTLGPDRMSKLNKILYFLGYTGMGAGLILLLGIGLLLR